LISEATEAARVQERKAEASPKREDFEKEFGKHRVKDEKDGSWTLTLHEREDIRKAHQMQEGTRRIEVERGAEMQARMKRERVVRRDGKTVDVPEDMVDTMKRSGIRPVGRNGVSAAIRSNLSQSYGNYKQGPKGMWFVWNDGWEPTSLWSKADYGDEQSDPAGNNWVKRNGEWVLDSEV
jgi:hypothetical protein